MQAATCDLDGCLFDALGLCSMQHNVAGSLFFFAAAPAAKFLTAAAAWALFFFMFI